MSRFTLFVCLFGFFCLGTKSSAQDTKGPLTGRWFVSSDFHGTTLYFQLELIQQDDKLTGKFDGDKLEGTVSGNTVHFVSKDEQGGSADATATLKGNVMTGKAVSIDPDNPGHPETYEFTATLIPPRPSGPAKRHEFVPTTFYRQFSPFNKPVLTANPGDSIHTTTVDAGGKDEKGVSRVLGGNPETGPFYIESAFPGDTLVVHILKLRLNRDWAMSDDYIVDRAIDRDLAVKAKDDGGNVRWHLDAAKGVATTKKPGDHLKQYTVPLRPMLGCVATAPNPGQAPPGTGDSGHFGGNMDFNEVIEGATVYLPISVPGAMLYLGDGHAAQGDGELNGNALETSMDVEFSVDVISGKRIGSPRVESATHIMVVGLSGSLDDAFRVATASMAHWLMDDYKLTSSEVAQVLGTAAEYKVGEVADRNAGMVLKINKERLATIPRTEK
ncbi:MAG TPA: acetamidase/formamidase family protein [Candidatus Eremiobacteraceae bacterium]|nr:acetamidase/formamidase family protein [Candidatus Eremiobacteraceae bacterium]